MKQELKQLSKTISHALRHEPWFYELELDDKGWVLLNDLLPALRAEKESWSNVTETTIKELIQKSEKQRFEIHNGKIRSLYGHSVPKKLIKESAEPPKILYHGTSSEVLEKIIKKGLKPMHRQYVHLSENIKDAKEVGLRKSRSPIILKIAAKEAYDDEISFYVGNEHVWLADYIPAKYIE